MHGFQGVFPGLLMMVDSAIIAGNFETNANVVGLFD
jgi:hypothetical protein